MAKVIWSEPALAQLDAIAAIIELDKPAAARAVVKRIFSETDRLAEFGKIGRAIPEFPHADYRQLWVKPCWVYYRLAGGGAIILHVRRAEMPLDLSELL